MKYALLLVLTLTMGCAAGVQLGNFHTGGSFLCGSYSRMDGQTMQLDGCLEETIHGSSSDE